MLIVWGRVRSTLISDLKALLRNLPILGPSEAMLPKKSKLSQNAKKVRRSPIEGTDSSLNLTVRMDLGSFGGIYSCVPPDYMTVAAGDGVSRMTRHAGGRT